MSLRMTIVGLGVIGSSIGLALKKTGVAFDIVGHDKDHDAARAALKNGAVSRTDWNLIGACDGADLIVICTPLSSIKDTLSALRHDLKAGCAVTDTASLKSPVLTWAKEILPPSVHYVGGHPILRKDVPRPIIASADLLEDALYCLTPQPQSPPEAVQTVADLAEATGATPFFLEAEEHDSLIAAVEQLPLLAGMAMQQVAGSGSSSREAQRLAGPDFAAATQPLSSELADLLQSCWLNTANLTRWLDTCIAELSHLRGLLASTDSSALREAFEKTKALHEQWSRPAESEETDYSAFSTTRLMMGGLFTPRKPKQ
jgi:prephenate dehydrogenase